ncbi:U3 small nucleolar RNA-associated protein [Coemansia sp. Benny D160-2]|nr:U3 small nucleolar RNA-associated protein [Coemansia sp. Benny D160-2]
MEYKPIGAAKRTRTVRRGLPESAYWKRFASPVLVKEHGMVTWMEFSPTQPHDLLVTAAMRVQLYGARTGQVRRTFGRFTATARSGSFRSDGRLIVAGDDANSVVVLDARSRTVLRSFRGHSDPVHVTRFLPDRAHVLSASDDRTVRVWDMASQAEVSRFDGHSDYVRSGCVVSAGVVATGAYDRTVRVWDVRAARSVATIAIEDPVEAVTALAGGGAVAVAGGPGVHVHDLVMGGRRVATLGNHEKTVTALCVDGARLLAGSLDHHVKIYDMQAMRLVHSTTYPAPVLSVALSPDATRLAVGMTSGVFSLRTRRTPPNASSESATRDLLPPPPLPAADLRIEQRRRKGLADYDRLLRKFHHARALDAVLANNRTGMTVVALLQELTHRGALVAALAGRDELSLDPIVRFLVKFIDHPRYTPVLVAVADALLDIYADLLLQSDRIAALFVRLRSKVRVELRVQQEMQMLLGSVDMLMAASRVAHAPAAAVASDDDGAAAAMPQ